MALFGFIIVLVIIVAVVVSVSTVAAVLGAVNSDSGEDEM